MMGIDLKIEWSAPHTFEIKKGHRYFDQTQQRIILNSPPNSLNFINQGEFKIEKAQKLATASGDLAGAGRDKGTEPSAA
jgi:hypothetical protein